MQKKNSTVFLWSIIVALGGLLFGFDTAVISGVEKTIQQLFQLSPFWQGFTISSALIGTVIGSLVSGLPADRYGRKPILFVTAFLFAISAIASALVNTLSLFIIFRFIGGLAIGASSVIAPMYISEISPAAVRGRMTALFQFNVITGILLAYVSNYFLRDFGGEDAWRYMLGIGSIPAAVFLLLLFLVPESPRYLIISGRAEEARAIFIRAGIANIERELDEIRASMNMVKENLFSKQFKKPIAIAFLVAMFNQLSGINAILYYAPRIFELSGISSADAYLQPIIIGVTNAIFTMVGMAVIDKAGRKKLLIAGSLGMTVCLALVANSFYRQDFDGYGLLIFLVGYIMFFAFSTGAVIWVLISEVFPNSVRGQGQSLGSFTHWIFATIITFLFPVIVGDSPIGGGHAFAFFAVMMTLQAIVVWKYFPETKGRTLEEISAELVRDSGT